MASSGAGEPDAELHCTKESLQLCQSLPKVELHAHLNGSVRDATIRPDQGCGQAKEGSRQLAARNEHKGLTVEDVDNITSKRHRTLEDCFRLFSVIHQCTSDHDSIRQITQEVVHDFAEDNVVYLELRTSPKARPEAQMTKESYTGAVLEGMQRALEELQGRGRWMKVRLLLSIDRRESTAEALGTVRLAAQLMDRGVVGVDLSGNPRLGAWDTWREPLQEARRAGLRVTLHAGEVPAPEEVSAMLAFRPDRLGHMCCLDPDLKRSLLVSRIPVELCLTSNIKTQSVPGYPDHHFALLHEAGHPVVLCTDDSGVFGTTLSQEYAIAQTVFGLTDAQMAALALEATNYTFLPEAEALELKEELKRRIALLLIA